MILRTIIIILLFSTGLFAQANIDSTGETFIHFFTTPFDTNKAVMGPMREIKDPSGFVYIDYALGKGDSAMEGKLHFLRFLGEHANGRFVDTSFCGKKLFSFTMGANEVMRGLELGVKGMRCGGRRQLRIPASLGYGEKGNPSNGVAPNETLVFYVELVKVE